MKKVIQKFNSVLKSSKSKILVGSFIAFASTNSFAAVTFDPTTGFGGTVDLTFFYSCIAIAIPALVAIWAVKKGISIFR